ncbi:hypothetical protein H5410_031022 [Solanum commersonii]|uniref:Uncharacterized protein n=1 Tax=Solanum commersonii TaxID=4109 RepID=A0A9J5YKF6_SOLCO|nr:hypothetical protein H5410_031022 [Solanum commersonii]
MSTCKLADSQYNLLSKGKMNDKDEFDAATNIMIPIENLEVQDLAKLSATTFPTFKTPIYFRKANLPSSDLPNQPKQTQHIPTHGQVPPTSPIIVRTMPDLSNRNPTIPTMKQILWEHVATPYESHVPPVYVAGAPTFTTPVVVNVPYEQVEPYNRVPLAALKRKERMFQLSLTNKEDHPIDTPTIPKLFHILVPIHQKRPAYAPRPRPNIEARNYRAYTPIVELYAQLFERLRKMGVLQPVEGKLPDPIPRNFDGNKRCVYHSGVQGHDTKDYYGLKNQIESLIRRGVIKCTPMPPNVNNNPLPNHENWEVNIVTLDDEYEDLDYPNMDEADTMTSSAYQRVGLNHFAHFGNHASCKAEASERHQHTQIYEPTLGRFHHGSSKTIFILEKALIPNQAGNDDIIKGIGNLFVAMVGEKEEINLSKLTICDVEPREILQNWTISPSLFQLESL